MGKPKKSGSVNIAGLRPYLVHPTAFAWKVLPTELKRQVGSPERLNLYKGMFGPRDPALEPPEPASETTEPVSDHSVASEPVVSETTKPASETTAETTDPEPPIGYVPSDAHAPKIISLDPLEEKE